MLGKPRRTMHNAQPVEADFLQVVTATLRWIISLGNKLRRQVPLATSVCVLAALVSQTALLVAFLLPLKVVILLGSDTLPRYYPPALAGLNREALIIWLSIASVAFYGLNLLADQLTKSAADRGARHLLASTGKLVLFEDQDEIASNAYKHFTSALAGGLFVLLAMLLLLWLYPPAVLLLVVYFPAATLLLVSLAGNARVRRQLEYNTIAWVTVVTSVGFLLVFMGIVADFLLGSPPAFTPAIVALLLTRQLTNKIKNSSNSLNKLLAQRGQIDALFFQRQILLPDATATKSFWPLLSPEQRDTWVPQALVATAGSAWATPSRISWWPLNEPNVAALHCEFHERPGLLLKLFARDQTRQALHEATLLIEPPAYLPAPALLGVTEVDGLHCHVLQLPEGARPINGLSDTQRLELLAVLMRVHPPRELALRYSRSHPLLGQRLKAQILDHLCAATDSRSEPERARAWKQIDLWRSQLRDTPLAFSLKVEAGQITESADGRVLLLHWGNWALEPCGFDWSDEAAHHHLLQQALSAAHGERDDLGSTGIHQVQLTALSADFERYWKAARLDDAIALLASINRCLEEAPTTLMH